MTGCTLWKLQYWREKGVVMPKVEVEAKSSLLPAYGFDATRIFVERN
ncbi:hypothetical protein [Nostoc sp. C117]